MIKIELWQNRRQIKSYIWPNESLELFRDLVALDFTGLLNIHRDDISICDNQIKACTYERFLTRVYRIMRD